MKNTDSSSNRALLSVKDLSVQFRAKRFSRLSEKSFYAVRDVSLNVKPGETFCLVGESGSGKTALIWTILGIYKSTRGKITYRGKTDSFGKKTVPKELLSSYQIVFQNSGSSLNPFRRIEQSLQEPLIALGVSRERRKEIVNELALQSGLTPDLLHRYPRELSGGQKQRACIVRALSVNPEMLFLDEPFTGLDVITAGQVAEILSKIKEEKKLTLFLITHDLGMVKKHGTTIAVMFLGRIMEKAPVAQFFLNPRHPYSEVLLSNVLKPGLWKGKRILINRERISREVLPEGCVFARYCHKKLPRCSIESPVETEISPGYFVYCHLYSEGLPDV